MPAKPKIPVWIIPAAAGALAAAVAVYGLVNFFGVKTALKNEDFTAADTYLDNISVAVPFLRTERIYTDAGLLLESGQTEKAGKVFQSLGSAYSSQEMASEATYRTAAVLANMNKFDEAISRFEKLNDYEDSKQLSDRITIRKGYYSIANGDVEAGFAIFDEFKKQGYEGIDEIILDANYQYAMSLAAEEYYYEAYGYLKAAAGYLDADVMLLELSDMLYTQAIDFYYAGDYENAYYYFDLLYEYQDSASYDVLSYVRYYYDSGQSVEFIFADTATLVWDYLVPIIDFEDTALLLTTYDDLATEFLTGTWYSDEYYFGIDEYGDVNTNLPLPDYAAYYTISNGFFQVYNDDTDSEGIWEIYVATSDTIYIYAYELGDTYAFYRY
jgi:predicted negative regulator of RcsB-dependent stress response